jgi:hypothetical protein
MVLINFLFFISNVLLLIFGFVVIKKKTERLVINKEILADIKKEINSMIIKLNETTMNNINLVEGKARSLEKLIKLADRKAGGLDGKIADFVPENGDFKKENSTYSPTMVVKQSNEITDKIIKREEVKNGEFKVVEERIKDLPINEKVRYLLNEGFSMDEIKKRFGLSEGEFELIMNLEN